MLTAWVYFYLLTVIAGIGAYSFNKRNANLPAISCFIGAWAFGIAGTVIFLFWFVQIILGAIK